MSKALDSDQDLNPDQNVLDPKLRQAPRGNNSGFLPILVLSYLRNVPSVPFYMEDCSRIHRSCTGLKASLNGLTPFNLNLKMALTPIHEFGYWTQRAK